jgi:hypothetical protein
MVAVVAASVFVASSAPAVTPPPVIPLHPTLAPLERFAGCWQGLGEGTPGKSGVRRVYTAILNGRFLFVSNQSFYAPQEKNPKGETHEDLGYFSFDKGRQRLVLRQFHGEGFVNQYVATSADFQGDILVFESEALENIAAGFRARETYRFSGANAFEEIFEVAEPDKDFTVYSLNRLQRC